MSSKAGRKTRGLLLHGAMALLALSIAAPTRAASVEMAQVLDDQGWLLAVGGWDWMSVATSTGGTINLRVPKDDLLRFELRTPEGTVFAEGLVPGTDDGLTDLSPVLSRNPVNGEILLVWSRQPTPGSPLEITSLAWQHQAWAQSRDPNGTWHPALNVIASGPEDQLDASMVHDASGQAHVAWREAGTPERIHAITLADDGEELGRVQMSSDTAPWTSAPLLGVDTYGSLFLAWLSLDSPDTQPHLVVRSPASEGGGLVFLPNPIIELERMETIGDVLAAPASASSWKPPALRVSVLGGTPVLWWTEDSDSGEESLYHVSRSPEGLWDAQSVGRIALTTGTGMNVVSALELIETRIRTVQPGLVTPTLPQEPPVLQDLGEFRLRRQR